MPTHYDEGALLEVRGETWRLTRRQRFESCAVLTLEGRDRSNGGDRLRVIDPFDRPRTLTSRTPRRRSRRTVLTAALAAIVGAREPSRLWTAANASIELWPHQLEPALAVIGGATRLLLADAVGLGKTIQAGLILSELFERGWIEHALIVCPAGLREAWARELGDRFGIAARVIDQASIAERVSTLPPGVSPWTGHAVAVASIDFVKRDEVLAAIDNEPLELVIADEAHHLSPGTDRGAAVARLASRAPWCVFLSATPHSGDRAAFDYLTSLGTSGDRITIFRRHRTDVGLAVTRRTHILGVRPTAEEATLLAAIDAYARAIWHARGREDAAVRLIAMTMARRAASSREAIARTLARRMALLGDAGIEPAQPVLPWEEADESDGAEPDASLSARGLESPDDERKALEHLIALARCCAISSKIRRLLRLLDCAGEPAVVFTEYRDTVDAIVAALSTTSRRIGVIHGGLAPDLRRAAVEGFNDGRIDVLVATDAAGEGLNLQQRCRLVIDVELPWNPMRLEQRVGRVDRLGQPRTVHAVRLFHPGTIESDVLQHLRAKHHLADRDIAAAVFEGASIDSEEPRIESVVIAGGIDEARRLAHQRRLPWTRASGPAWVLRRGRRVSRLIALHRVTSANDAGCLVSERLYASSVQLGANPESPRRWRQLLDGLGPFIPAEPHRAAPGVSNTIDRRIAAIRARLRRERSSHYQRSLFDARADGNAAARRAVLDRLCAALERARRSVTADVPADSVRAEFVAAWPQPTAESTPESTAPRIVRAARTPERRE
jgi:ERCC4-related helicase